MKKTLLFICLAFLSTTYYAQDPVILNADLSKIDRTGESSGCSCTSWTNKDLGDQGESSSWNTSTSFGVKFDDTESDLMYQEIAVSPNTDYTFTYYYNFENKGTDDLSSSLEVRILAGTGYVSGYTPTYLTANEWKTKDFGYEDIAEVEKAANNLNSETITDPGDKTYRTGTLTFSSGSNSSVALFLRAIGRDVTGTNGKGYAWSNAKHEIRIDYVGITNNGATASVNDIFSSKISIYPNPANDFVTVSTSETITSMEVYNLIGKRVISSSSIKDNTINVSNLAKGVYVLKVMSNDLVGSRKIIIE